MNDISGSSLTTQIHVRAESKIHPPHRHRIHSNLSTAFGDDRDTKQMFDLCKARSSTSRMNEAADAPKRDSIAGLHDHRARSERTLAWGLRKI